MQVGELSRLSRSAIDEAMQAVLEVLVLKQPSPEALGAEVIAVLKGEATTEAVVQASDSALELSDTDARSGVEAYLSGIQGTLQQLYKAAVDARPEDKAAAATAMVQAVGKVCP